MFVLVVSLLLIVAAACIGLSRIVETRRLGLIAAGASGLGGFLLLVVPQSLATLVFPTFTVGTASFGLVGQLSPGDSALAAALLWGGAMAFMALAAAIAPTIHGFGTIFGWSSMALTAALVGLAAPPLSMLTPLAWAVAAMASYTALRSSGALVKSETLPRGLALGLLASGLLLGGLLGAQAALAQGELPSDGVAIALLLAVVAMAGVAPLGMARDETVVAPAPLGALIYGLVMPVLGLGYLLRLVAILPEMPGNWAATLVIVGSLGMVASAAGAYGERQLRPLLGWVSSAQASMVIVAAGLASTQAKLAGPALLLNLMLATIGGAAAIVDLERNTGSDLFAEGEPGPRLELTGALWAGASLAALGLPPFWGFWGRQWLFRAVLEETPWALPLLVAGASLMALALLMPLVRFWPAPDPRSRPAAPGQLDPISGGLSLAPLLVLGIVPQLAGAFWISTQPSSADGLPIDLSTQVGVSGSGMVIVAIVLLIARLPITRQIAPSPEEETTQLAADALGESLRPLAWLGRADALLAAVWNGMLGISRLLQIMMSVFEQRYYLLGVLMALLTVMLLMAQ